MSEVLTKPLLTDETGQGILAKLDEIIAGLKPNAQGVSFDKTGCEIITANNAQDALKQLDSGLDDTNSSLTNKVDNESNSEMKMKIGTINTSSSITFTAQIAFLITFGTNGEQGIFGCRSGVIQDIITAGSAITHSVSGTTYTFNNTSASVGARYLLAYI